MNNSKQLRRNVKLVQALAKGCHMSKLAGPIEHESGNIETWAYILELSGHLPIVIHGEYVPLLKLEFAVMDEGMLVEASPFLPEKAVPEELRALPQMCMALVNRENPEFKPDILCRVRVPDDMVQTVEHLINYVNSRSMTTVLRMYRPDDLTTGMFIPTAALDAGEYAETFETMMSLLCNSAHFYVGEILRRVLDHDTSTPVDAIFDGESKSDDPKHMLRRMLKSPYLGDSLVQHMERLLEDDTMSREALAEEARSIVSAIIKRQQELREHAVVDADVMRDLDIKKDADTIIRTALADIDAANKETTQPPSLDHRQDMVDAESFSTTTSASEDTTTVYTIGDTQDEDHK